MTEQVRNPFAIRNGQSILISDLTPNERGAKCQCQCPHCKGAFNARMGNINKHHFAHSMNPCDEVVAYTTGLYKHIFQILSSGKPFHVPALMITHSFVNRLIDESDAESLISIVKGDRVDKDSILVSKGNDIVFERVELSYDTKNHIQAIELSLKGRIMAIKVMPPDTVCKLGAARPHKDIATLVLDFTKCYKFIQNANSDAFSEFLLSSNLVKDWISNPLISRVYKDVVERNNKAYQVIADFETPKNRETEKQIAEQWGGIYDKARYIFAYNEVKDSFTQQNVEIRDSYGKRWAQCELCGEIMPEDNFLYYGGVNRVNLGQCKKCKYEKGDNPVRLTTS